MLKTTLRTFVAACALSATLSACTADGHLASSTDSGMTPPPPQTATARPALQTTNAPAPEVIYRRGSRDTLMADDNDVDLSNKTPYYRSNVETQVSRKVNDLSRDLSALQGSTSKFQSRLDALQSKSDADAAKYYEYIAAINTELQSGTTPGNPVLVERWNAAEKRLDSLSQSAGFLNDLSSDLANEASKASYLQENVRGAYGLSGAVKNDHDRLRALEDNVNQEIVNLNRLLTTVGDEINRRGAYLRSERANMQTLSLAISNGDLYGQNISNTLYKRATEANAEMYRNAPVPARGRPLVIIRFDRPNVNYQAPLYNAVKQALDKYPNARFDLVAVSPSRGNPAEVALASSEARKNGEAVLRSLAQMGLPVERVRLNAANSSDARNSEVHIYLQ
ncbi:MAG TPA: hypothetical protein VEF76_05120 [Patescibacteria group bacterium]|nr:hypothetical protein [Patescibacteria group bacterium]